ncbi:MAG TPA: isochorismatase family cysteine hydrolase [Chloroflexota bacterium]|nr:isochorismatase family cysteine hydrolase [Chloroflexota bacterium]
MQTLAPTEGETAEFLAWLNGWYQTLPDVPLTDLVTDPARTAILTADLIVGFCHEGTLASERVGSIVPANVSLIERARALGVKRVVLLQDTHDQDAPEFQAWPPHCVRGTRESETVRELSSLSYSNEFDVVEKNALSAGVATRLPAWLEDNEDVTTYLVGGDCTDLCVYQLAMHIRMWADATNRHGRQVIVPASAVQTFDLPVAAAGEGMPHPGDLMHRLFLYHMSLNGIRIVGDVV